MGWRLTIPHGWPFHVRGSTIVVFNPAGVMTVYRAKGARGFSFGHITTAGIVAQAQ